MTHPALLSGGSLILLERPEIAVAGPVGRDPVAVATNSSTSPKTLE
jgi:hypothetical protein